MTDLHDPSLSRANGDRPRTATDTGPIADGDPPTTRRRKQRNAGLPSGPRRPRNTAWIAAGSVLVAFSGLAGASMWSGLSNRIDVLAARDLITEGQVISENDLTTMSIAADEGMKAVSPSQLDELVGQVATGPIGGGSIIHPAQFMADNAEGQPQVIVGAALQPGQYPRIELLPGDAVKIIETSGPNADQDEETVGPREIAVGEVAEIRELSQSDVLLVSLRVDEAVSAKISERSEQGRLTLALLDGIPVDSVEPIEPATPTEPAEPVEDVDAATDEPVADEAAAVEPQPAEPEPAEPEPAEPETEGGDT